MEFAEIYVRIWGASRARASNSVVCYSTAGSLAELKEFSVIYSCLAPP